METTNTESQSPLEHARNMAEILSSVKALCRSEVDVLYEPKIRALLETTAEVLGGLEKAFHDYQQGEHAWRDDNFMDANKSSDPWD